MCSLSKFNMWKSFILSRDKYFMWYVCFSFGTVHDSPVLGAGIVKHRKGWILFWQACFSVYAVFLHFGYKVKFKVAS